VGAVLLAILLEICRLFPHMQPRRNEVVLDEAGDPLLRVDLGIQPSTTASHRRGAEIQQHRFLPSARVAQYPIDVMAPRDFHITS
jgi:hypothetical protein